MVTIHTSMGDIVLKLHDDTAPVTSQNFRDYVSAGHYNGVIFHRVIDGFMIQGGGLNENLEEKPSKAPIKNEANKAKPNKKGTIAMARTMDPHSASAQFFINLKDNAFLDFKSEDIQGWGYCVFGEVTDGMDVVEKIAKVKTGSRYGHDDVPVETVMIESVELTA